MAVTVNNEKALAKLNALRPANNQDQLKSLAASMGRTAALVLARSTPPPGTGEQAKTQGESAVARDIRTVYATPGDVWNDISNTRTAALFWSAVRAGEFDVAAAFAREFSTLYRNVPWGRFDGGALHKGARDARGHVRGGPRLVVTNHRQLWAYVKQEQQHVGTAKGAWADCVRALGGTIRGLREEGDITANWITRKGHGRGRASFAGSTAHPTVTITNSVPYIDQIVDQGMRVFAQNIAVRRLKESEHQIKEYYKHKFKSAA